MPVSGRENVPNAQFADTIACSPSASDTVSRPLTGVSLPDSSVNTVRCAAEATLLLSVGADAVTAISSLPSPLLNAVLVA